MQTLHHMHNAEILRSHSHTVLSIQEPLKDYSPLLEKRSLYSEPAEDYSYDIKSDTLYVSKCICLVSQMQYVSATRQFLRQLYEAVEKPCTWHLSLECYVYNMLFEVPLPPAGRSMKLFGISTPIFCQRPSKYMLCIRKNTWFLIPSYPYCKMKTIPQYVFCTLFTCTLHIF